MKVAEAAILNAGKDIHQHIYCSDVTLHSEMHRYEGQVNLLDRLNYEPAKASLVRKAQIGLEAERLRYTVPPIPFIPNHGLSTPVFSKMLRFKITADVVDPSIVLRRKIMDDLTISTEIEEPLLYTHTGAGTTTVEFSPYKGDGEVIASYLTIKYLNGNGQVGYITEISYEG
jgi:hypothetical protein